MTFFNPNAPLIIHRGKLPHWRQESAIYFVTFRLADFFRRPEARTSKPGMASTVLWHFDGESSGISIQRHSAFLEIVTRQAEHLAKLRPIFVITDRVGKASRLTSSAAGARKSKPGRLTYFGILRGNVRGISIKRHSAFLEIVHGRRSIWQTLRPIFVITDRVGKASRLTSSAGRGPEE